MTQEMEDKIHAAVARGDKEIYWTPEELLLIAHTASVRGWGMSFMGISHSIKDVV